METFQVVPVGRVRAAGKRRTIEIAPDFRAALHRLGEFSHLVVVWWADKRDSEKYRSRLQTKPPYAPGVLTGIFATRAEYRPNPIALTVVRIEEVDETRGLVRVAGLDARPGTPVLDLKGYFPVCDRVKNASIPAWLPDWPEWVPEED